jgi:hypothetical protein
MSVPAPAPRGWVDSELPLYVLEPERRAPKADPEPKPPKVPGADALAAGSSTPLPPSTIRLNGFPPNFSRLIDVPGDDLPAVLARWWAETSAGGPDAPVERLTVAAPRVERGTFTLHGRLRRRFGLGSLPVAVDLWAHNVAYTRLTMVPRVRVRTCKRYFRAGNDALDRLTADLCALSLALARAG